MTRKSLKISILIFIFCLIIKSDLQAQWIQQSAPDSATVLNTINFINTTTGVSTGWDFNAHYITTGRALYTTNAGTNWIPSAVPYACRVIASAEYINSTTLYGTGAINLGFDSPFSKLSSSDFDNLGRMKVSAKNNSIDAGNNSRGAFFKSTNGGFSWIEYGTLPAGCTYLTYMDFIDANTGVVIADPGPTQTSFLNIYKTTNGGTSWTALLPPDTKGNLEDIKYVNENVIFAVGYQIIDSLPKNVIMKSTNGGMNWTTQFTGTTFNNRIHFINSQNGFLTGVIESIGKVFKTTDQGNTWNDVLTADSILFQGINFYGETGVGIAFGNKNSESGIYYPFAFRTANSGLTWSIQQISSTFDPILISSYMLDRYNYYISTAGFSTGVIYHTTNGGSVGIGENPGAIANEYFLSQNYPNPFNPTTLIKYNVPSRSQIILKVYNLNGKEIVTLVDGIKAEGSYDVKFDAASLPSGIYYYKMTSGSFTETKKMILVK